MLVDYINKAIATLRKYKVPTDEDGSYVMKISPEGIEHSEWISVDEKLPDEVGWYLACRSKFYGQAHKQYVCDAFYDLIDWSDIHEFIDAPVTHWMPLPEPPEMN